MLIIAGYDPCGGAGILADVKTAENHAVYAYAVCTGYTFQNSRRISHIHWFSGAAISRQISMCYEDRDFEWVKLGITRSPTMVRNILGCLKEQQPRVKIIWDPVLASSGGTPFMEGMCATDFEALLPLMYMVMPNLPELYSLYPGTEPEAICARLSQTTSVYLKGGHEETSPGSDRLFIHGTCHRLPPGPEQVFTKHGSGCVLSSALTANLAAGGGELLKAARESKRYTEQFLGSDRGLLGWHKKRNSHA